MFIDKFDEWKSNLPTLTEAQEAALIYHIIETADHLTPDNIARHIISPTAAWDVVSNDDSMWQTAIACNPIPKDLAFQATTNGTDLSKFAYMLAFEQPEIATQLLNELEYYRSIGRI